METQWVEFLEQLTRMIVDLTAVPFLLPLIVLLVGLIKRIPIDAIQSLPANVIHLVVQVLAWVAYAVATHYGKGAEFESWIAVLTPLLQLVVSYLGGAWLYNQAKQANMPLWGYQRPYKFMDDLSGRG